MNYIECYHMMKTASMGKCAWWPFGKSKTELRIEEERKRFEEEERKRKAEMEAAERNYNYLQDIVSTDIQTAGPIMHNKDKYGWYLKDRKKKLGLWFTRTPEAMNEIAVKDKAKDLGLKLSPGQVSSVSSLANVYGLANRFDMIGQKNVSDLLDGRFMSTTYKKDPGEFVERLRRGDLPKEYSSGINGVRGSLSDEDKRKFDELIQWIHDSRKNFASNTKAQGNSSIA